MKRGYCSHPHKKSRIVVEWKCVDIQYPEAISPEERARRTAECRKKDHYGVCDLCKFFAPDAEQPAPAPPAPKPAEKPVYTESKDTENTGNAFDESWLE